MCRFESSQKDESRAQTDDCSKAPVLKVFSNSLLANPETVNSSKTKITKKIIAKISHNLL